MSLKPLDFVCDTIFRPYHLVKLCCFGLFGGGLVAVAFWREPLVMLSLAGAAMAICFPLWWLAAPKKAPRLSEEANRRRSENSGLITDSASKMTPFGD
jgi:hypothetical protein